MTSRTAHTGLSPTSFDVVIVGNGILALTCALTLTDLDPTCKVAVVGPRDRPGSASTASGAMLGCYGEVTKSSLTSAPGRLKHEVAVAAARMWPNHLARLIDESGECFDAVKGTYVVLNARSGPLDDANFEAIVAATAGDGVRCEEIPADSVPGLDPVPDARPLRALHLADEDAVDSGAVLRALDTVLSARPTVDIVDASAAGLLVSPSGASVTGVRLVDGTVLAAGQVLCAAGAFTTALLAEVPALSGHVAPVLAGVGVAAVVARVPPTSLEAVVRTPNRSGACGLHAVPLDRRRLYLGATNNVAFAPALRGRTGLHHFLLNCAIEQIHQGLYDAELIEWRVGNRPTTLDGFPLLGAAPLNGLFVLTGTYRDGFHCSPALAAQVVAEMTGTAGAFDGHPFTPVRDLITTMTAEEAIAEWVRHYVTGAYENAMVLPKFMDTADFAAVIEPRARRLYEQIGVDVGLAPEVLAMVEFAPDRDEQVAWLADALKPSPASPIALPALESVR